MNSKPYEVKLAPKIEKWFRQLDPELALHLLELLVEGELKTNPYPRPDQPKLIKSLRGLKKTNPKCYRLRVYRDQKAGIYDEYRFYYTITTPHVEKTAWSGYVILLEISGPSAEDKKSAVERLKKLKGIKLVELQELLGLPT